MEIFALAGNSNLLKFLNCDTKKISFTEYYVPLEDYSKPRNAIYEGVVFKSISDLPDGLDYEEKFKQRLEALETNKSNFCVLGPCNFQYNFLFNKSVLEENGFEVAFLDQNPDRNLIGAHICAILNSQKRGILLIGIHTSNTGSHLIHGVVLGIINFTNFLH